MLKGFDFAWSFTCRRTWQVDSILCQGWRYTDSDNFEALIHLTWLYDWCRWRRLKCNALTRSQWWIHLESTYRSVRTSRRVVQETTSRSSFQWNVTFLPSSLPGAHIIVDVSSDATSIVVEDVNSAKWLLSRDRPLVSCHLKQVELHAPTWPVWHLPCTRSRPIASSHTDSFLDCGNSIFLPAWTFCS